MLRIPAKGLQSPQSSTLRLTRRGVAADRAGNSLAQSIARLTASSRGDMAVELAGAGRPLAKRSHRCPCSMPFDRRLDPLPCRHGIAIDPTQRRVQLTRSLTHPLSCPFVIGRRGRRGVQRSIPRPIPREMIRAGIVVRAHPGPSGVGVDPVHHQVDVLLGAVGVLGDQRLVLGETELRAEALASATVTRTALKAGPGVSRATTRQPSRRTTETAWARSCFSGA